MQNKSIIFETIQTVEQAKNVFELMISIAMKNKVSLKPTPVEPNSCCGRGCDGCVWSAFLQAAEHWRTGALLILDAFVASNLLP